MSKGRPALKEVIQKDIQELAHLGYRQQLFRQMGGFSNFAISFSIISVLTGAIVLIFSIPPNELVFWTMLLLVAVMAVYWTLHAGRHFHGPTKEDEKALRAALKLTAAGKQ